MLSVVNDLLAMGDLQPNDIGVISPYNGQVRELVRLFEMAGGASRDSRMLVLKSRALTGTRVGKKR